MSKDEPDISLGFVAKPENVQHMQSKYFPSKMGGKPAWLSQAELPKENELRCAVCKTPLAFLLQAYAPLDENECCFHRTVFVFACRNGQCYAKNDNRAFAVFRSQLPRTNDFYSTQPSEAESTSAGEPTFAELIDADSSRRTPLCVLCGCSARQWCSRCRGPRYCGKDHQTLHWKAGHKAECRPSAAPSTDGTPKLPSPDAQWSRQMAADAGKALLLPEMELLIETECELEMDDAERDGDGDGSDSDGDEEQQLKDYEAFVRSHGGTTGALDGEVSATELAAAAAGSDGIVDDCFRAFKKRMAIAPEQVLRHNRDGDPLWLTTEHQVTDGDVPDCSCGAKRSFEFQILPQLLSHLHLDTLAGPSVDWATLAVYTCSNSCSTGNAYKPEFLWKQDF